MKDTNRLLFAFSTLTEYKDSLYKKGEHTMFSLIKWFTTKVQAFVSSFDKTPKNVTPDSEKDYAFRAEQMRQHLINPWS